MVERKNVFQEKLVFSGWKTKSCWKNLKPSSWSKKRFSRKIIFQWLKDKKFLKNLKPSGWKKKSCWKILNSAVERKKLLKILKPSTILALERILNLRKKGAFLILDCVESRLDLNRSFNRSRWVFFSKVYIIPKKLRKSDSK